MVKGLLIETDWKTGERAYGVNPKDPNLRAIGASLWQCLDHEPKGDWEIRAVLDHRDLSQYTGKIILDDGSEVYSIADIPSDLTIVDVDGVIVLSNNDEINTALSHLPDKIYGRIEKVRTWCEKQGITPKSIEDEIKTKSLSAKTGYIKIAKKRGKPTEHIVFGHPSYAFLKKAFDSSCPYTWKAQIPKV